MIKHSVDIVPHNIIHLFDIGRKCTNKMPILIHYNNIEDHIILKMTLY